MALCDKCGAQVPKSAVFCEWCGNRIGSALDAPDVVSEQQNQMQPEKLPETTSTEGLAHGPKKPEAPKSFELKPSESKKPEAQKMPKEKKGAFSFFGTKKAAAPQAVIASPALSPMEATLRSIRAHESMGQDSRDFPETPVKGKESKKGLFGKKEKKEAKKGGSYDQSSPYAPKKKSSTNDVIVLLLFIAIAIVAIGVVVSMLAGPPAPEDCIESWSCGEWALCDGGAHRRECTDANACGTTLNKPQDTFPCADEPINLTNTTNDTCFAIGNRCSLSEDCCDGYCLHYFCRENGTVFCGDGYCDEGETCNSCGYDCGECPRHRDLVPNVFTEPLGYLAEKPIKEGDYAIVRYFHSSNCEYCENPVNIDEELREMASEFKDIFALITINTVKYKDEANKYARVGGSLFVPYIRVEGFSNGEYRYSTLYSNALGQKLQDGDIKADVAEMICKHSDYCEFKDGKIMRTAAAANQTAL